MTRISLFRSATAGLASMLLSVVVVQQAASIPLAPIATPVADLA